MLKKRLGLIETRPNYYHGQLLLEDDFLAEQSYHVSARLRHNVNLHGWGIVRGLEVVSSSEKSVTVNPGFAIDEFGHDIAVDQAENLDLSGFEPNDLVRVGLAYEEAELAGNKRKEGYALLIASCGTEGPCCKEESEAVLLATVQLDEKGQVRGDAIDYSKTKYAGAVLRRGWLRMPFRPIALVNRPPGEDEIPPAFRVGPTEALSPSAEDTGGEDKGAGGTMAIPIPPSIKKVTRFRIAGSINKGEIRLKFILGGWDLKEGHVHKRLVQDKIDHAPFLKTYEIANAAIDPEYHTLSLWLRGTLRTSISLVAVEFVY
jgi:hypothetical protein